MIPSNFDEVTLEKWLEIEELKKEDLPIFNFNLEALTILSESDEWDNMDVEELYIHFNKINFIHLPLPTSYNNEIKGYKVNDFNKITLGQWIDLDEYIKNFNPLNIITTLYQKYSVDGFGNYSFEPYVYLKENRYQDFMEIPLTHVYGVITSFNQYRDRVLNAYTQLFDLEEDGEFTPSDEEKIILSNEEIEIIRKEIEQEKEKQKFSWQNLLYHLVNGDLTKIEKVLELPVLFVFNMLIMKKKFNL